MKIVGRVLISLAGTVALISAAIVGCSTTNNLDTGRGTSGQGETCTRTFDCKDGFVCQQGVCFATAGSVSDGGVLGDGGDGSVVTTGPHLGELRESCQTSRDCESPLECIGQECSVVNYGLTATGKVCGECNTPADCCELPVGFSAGFLEYEVLSDGGFVNYVTLNQSSLRCEDLLKFIGGDATVCSNAATLPSYQQDLATGCFYYNTYCGSCGANGPWQCTNNSCVYTAPCTSIGTVTAQAVGSCPTETRLGHGLGSGTCNPTDGGVSGACAAGCSTATDCDGKIPTGTNHACSASDAGGGGNCTCNAGACYFSCKSDLDCAAGKTCDTTVHLCKTGGCTADADCIQSLGNPRAKCTMNTCSVACTKDTECNPPSSICSAGTCQAAGCTSDVDCTGGGAHSFCVAAPMNTTQYSGAITN